MTSRQKLTYGIGSVGTGIFTTVPSVLLLYFLTTVVHIDVALAGVVILIPKALGLIGDPAVGVLADRLHDRSPIGRRWMMASGALLAGAGIWALFDLPQRHPGNFLLPALIFFLCTTGYSLFAVPYSALPAELSTHANGRQALVSARMGMAFVGVLIGGVSAPLVAGRIGYPIMGAVMGTVCVMAMGAFLLTCRVPHKVRGAIVSSAARPHGGTTRIVTKAFVIQMTAFVVLLAAVGAFSALLPFLVRDMGQSTDAVGVAMLVNIVVALLASLVWSGVIRRTGLRTAWQLAALSTCLAALAVGYASGLDIQFYAGMALGGVGLSGMQIAGFTGLAELTADRVDDGHGTGFITGIWMAGEKSGLASGPLLAGLGIKFFGTAGLGSAARISITFIPAALAVLSIVIIAFAFTERRTTPTAIGVRHKGRPT